MKEHIALIITNEKNQTLFIQRSLTKKTIPGAWSFPSGTVEENENPNKTAIREAFEELNIKIIPEKIIATKELPEFNVKLSFMICKIKENIPTIKEPQEIEQIDWMKWEEFFNRFTDNEIGHGLIWLRKNPEIWEKYNL